MKKMMKKGQAMVEYILIVCLIAIAGIAVVKYFGLGIMEKFVGASEAISEENGENARNEYEKQQNDDSFRRLGND